jgi:hypothetical protein
MTPAGSYIQPEIMFTSGVPPIKVNILNRLSYDSKTSPVKESTGQNNQKV